MYAVINGTGCPFFDLENSSLNWILNFEIAHWNADSFGSKSYKLNEKSIQLKINELF